MDQVPSAIAKRTISAATLVPVVFYHLDFDSSANSAQIFSLTALSTNGLPDGVASASRLGDPTALQNSLCLAEHLRFYTGNPLRLPKRPSGRSIYTKKTRWGSWERDTERAILEASKAVATSQAGMRMTKSHFVDKTEWDWLQTSDSAKGPVISQLLP